jgi:hypothetical protein
MRRKSKRKRKEKYGKLYASVAQSGRAAGL